MVNPSTLILGMQWNPSWRFHGQVFWCISWASTVVAALHHHLCDRVPFWKPDSVSAAIQGMSHAHLSAQSRIPQTGEPVWCRGHVPTCPHKQLLAWYSICSHPGRSCQCPFRGQSAHGALWRVILLIQIGQRKIAYSAKLTYWYGSWAAGSVESACQTRPCCAGFHFEQP